MQSASLVSISPFSVRVRFLNKSLRQCNSEPQILYLLCSLLHNIYHCTAWDLLTQFCSFAFSLPAAVLATLMWLLKHGQSMIFVTMHNLWYLNSILYSLAFLFSLVVLATLMWWLKYNPEYDVQCIGIDF